MKGALLTVLAAAALTLSGCASYYSVRMSHRIPERAAPSAAGDALSPVYVSVAGTPSDKKSDLAEALEKAAGAAYEPDLPAFAGYAAKSLADGGLTVAAYRVSYEKPDPMAGAFSPAGVLSLSCGPVSVGVTESRRTVTYRDKDKKTRTQEVSVWTYRAAASVSGTLTEWPSGKVIDSWTEEAEYSEEKLDDKYAPADWYEYSADKAAAAMASKAVARYAGRVTPRYRPVYFVKKDEESKKAARAAARGGCSSSSGFWKGKLASGESWRARLGLAVCAELSGDYAAARTAYEEARKSAGGDKDASRIKWDRIFSDLDYLSSPERVPAGPAPWFRRRVAVLPFSDETNSIDGPVMLRQLLHASLAEGGYDVQPLEETDELLRRRGFSDGAQLSAAKDKDIIAWLGVDAVIYGDITDFNEIMAGLYNKRHVAGAFSMAAAGEKGRVWTGVSDVSRVKLPKSLAGGFFSQLAKGLYERMREKPLYEESVLFVRRATGTLPRRVR